MITLNPPISSGVEPEPPVTLPPRGCPASPDSRQGLPARVGAQCTGAMHRRRCLLKEGAANLERNLAVWLSHLGEHAQNRLHQCEEAKLPGRHSLGVPNSYLHAGSRWSAASPSGAEAAACPAP